jgi:hypothetical protein
MANTRHWADIPLRDGDDTRNVSPALKFTDSVETSPI